MNWSLIHEVGIDDASPAVSGTQQRLRFPTFAGRAEDGCYLIGDELGKEKLVPFRFESRTIRVNADGEILFDTLAMGISDGFGCLDDDGSMAILCRTKWELLLLSPQGLITDRLALATMSKRMPRFVSRTGNGTFLIVFCDRAGKVDLVEVDKCGRLCWFLPPGSDPIGIAGSVQLTPEDTFLIADPIRHVAVEIDREGKVVWQFGEAGNPSAATSHLSSPSSIRVLSDGRRLIADTRNHRILLVALDGTTRQLRLQEGGLCDPMDADVLSNGHYLICDTGNSRVIEIDAEGRIVWHFGSRIGTERILSYPRSVDVTDSGRYLVADTAHDRIVEIGDGQVTERSFHGQPPLFWPRCARTLPSGGMLIADGRNGRIVEVAAEGNVLRELSEIDLGGRKALRDPHDVRMLPNGHLLIVDSSHDLVVEADWSGQVYRTIGTSGDLELSDPHSAQQLDDGCVVIADTGNHRILIVGRDGACAEQLYSIDSDSSCFRLNYPRYVEVIEDGTMVIADTGNNRVLAATIEGRFVWEFSRVPGARLSRLNQPRWAKLISRSELVVCDHFHHRILQSQCGDRESGIRLISLMPSRSRVSSSTRLRSGKVRSSPADEFVADHDESRLGLRAQAGPSRQYGKEAVPVLPRNAGRGTSPVA